MKNERLTSMCWFGAGLHTYHNALLSPNNDLIETRSKMYELQRYVENLKLNNDNSFIAKMANQILQYIIYIFNRILCSVVGHINPKYDKFNVKIKAIRKRYAKHFTELLYKIKDKISEIERYIKNKYNLIIHIFDIGLYDFNVDIFV